MIKSAGKRRKGGGALKRWMAWIFALLLAWQVGPGAAEIGSFVVDENEEELSPDIVQQKNKNYE